MCMKTFFAIAAYLVLVGFFPPQTPAQQGDERETIMEAMSQATDFWREFNQAVAKQDFFMAAEGLMGLAKTMKSLEFMLPEQGQGSQEDWDEIHQAIIKAAFKGIGACGDEDLRKLQTYGEEIRLLMNMGHTLFR